MSQAPGGYPPRDTAHRNVATPVRSTHPLWWLVAGVAVLVSAALIVWLLTSGSPKVDPTEPVSSSASPSVAPTDVAPTDPEGTDWGGFPPNNLDSLRDLSDPAFPKALGTFTLRNESRDDYSVFTDYEDAEASTDMTADVDYDTSSYPVMIQGMIDPAYVGRAVCGVTTGGGGSGVLCVMAGKDETLTVGSASDTITVDDAAAFTQELYDAL